MSSNIFNSVELRKPKRNRFDLSHDNKLSLDMGKLTPILNMECVPGDSFNLSSAQLLRFQPLIAPPMHQVDVFTHFFFVPNRLLWENWETFITGSKKGRALPEEDMPVFPTLRLTGLHIGTNGDYLGIPPFQSDAQVDILEVSAIPPAAAMMIYNEYYRDQNLQDELNCELEDGQNNGNLDLLSFVQGQPLRRAWNHDYFTSALPWAQKGDQVTIPLGTTAPLLFDSTDLTVPADKYWTEDGQEIPDAQAHFGNNPGDFSGHLEPFGATGVGTKVDVTKSTVVDLRTAVASTIRDLRRAFKLQEWLERNAVAGTRYTEHIRAHFGVVSPDARLQRPEYLGGGKSHVTFSEIAQTSESIETPQGTLAGHGINTGQSHGFSYTCKEHGTIIGFMSVMPKTAYSQGLDKQWSKFHRLDYLWPTFAHIGEQEIKNGELYIYGSQEQRDQVFGYSPRYVEYRHIKSSIHGDFRETLNYWHLSREFDSMPALTTEFIECDPGKRIFAVQDLPDDGDPTTPVRDWNTLLCHIYFQIKAIRPLPKFGTPMM